MLPTAVDDPSAAAAAASSSFPDADVYANGDSDDIDFPSSDPSHASQAVSSAAATAAAGGSSGSGGAGERRALFQRLWTEEDEIVILRAFAEFTAQRGTAFASHQYDTDPFYEEMRRRLQMDFSKSQLVEKLRRLKRKYRNCVDRLRTTGQTGQPFSFRSPHEQAIFEIARGIWRPTSDKHARDADSDDDALPAPAAAALAVAAPAAAPANGEVKSPSSRAQRRGRRRRTANADASEAPQPYTPAPAPVKPEDALPQIFPQGAGAAAAAAATAHDHGVAAANAEGGILAPMFKEMVRVMLSAGMAPPLGFPEPPALGIPMEGEKWRKQRILELEVYLRRIDLLQEQARSVLEELKSTPPATQ